MLFPQQELYSCIIGFCLEVVKLDARTIISIRLSEAYVLGVFELGIHAIYGGRSNI